MVDLHIFRLLLPRGVNASLPRPTSRRASVHASARCNFPICPRSTCCRIRYVGHMSQNTNTQKRTHRPRVRIHAHTHTPRTTHTHTHTFARNTRRPHVRIHAHTHTQKTTHTHTHTHACSHSTYTSTTHIHNTHTHRPHVKNHAQTHTRGHMSAMPANHKWHRRGCIKPRVYNVLCATDILSVCNICM